MDLRRRSFNLDTQFWKGAMVLNFDRYSLTASKPRRMFSTALLGIERVVGPRNAFSG